MCAYVRYNTTALRLPGLQRRTPGSRPVTTSQKIIITILSIAALAILAGLACAAFFLVWPASSAQTIAAAPTAAPPSATPMPQPSATPTATANPTQTPIPTPTGTLVVVETVQPSPTPTRANCVNQVSNFGASGVITDEEVKQYLRDVIPLAHLDGCRGIEYIPQQAQLHDTPLAGSIIPVYREIQVYAIGPNQSAAQILGTVTHEVGHNVHKNIRSKDMAIDGRWAKLHQQSQELFASQGLGFVSDYARTNKFEDFAETYRAYVLAPSFLKQVNPDKYEFMRLEVFAGLEYAP